MPAEYDINEGAKIWLILSSDVDCENSKMIGWNPTEYLFEHNLIYYEKTQIQDSSNKCKSKGSDINNEESEENDDIIDIEELSNFVTKLSNTLDKLIERFPILEKIIQKILLWLYLQFVV